MRSYIPNRELESLMGYDMIFMAPGIFKNNVDGDWKNIEVIKYLNMSNFKVASKVISFSNSKLTRQLYQRYGLPDMGCLEINMLQLQTKEKMIEEERDIDFLMVVSDVNRKIKNVKLFLKLSELIDAKFCLISGEKVDKKWKNIIYVEGLKEWEVDKFYRRSKILINCSYFDSMSNTVLEGIKNGCYILVSENNGIVDYINKENVVEGYSIKDWENVCRERIENWDKLDKKQNLKECLRKSWEVEIRLLEILSNR